MPNDDFIITDSTLPPKIREKLREKLLDLSLMLDLGILAENNGIQSFHFKRSRLRDVSDLTNGDVIITKSAASQSMDELNQVSEIIRKHTGYNFTANYAARETGRSQGGQNAR